MASNMKAVKLRIKSVQSTMQITKAMELVASSKLRKAKERAEVCRPYFTELHETLKEIARENTDFSSVYAKESSNNKTCYVVIAGDRGLAGGYNTNLFKCLEASAEGKDYMVLPVGKKAVEYFRQRAVSGRNQRAAREYSGGSGNRDICTWSDVYFLFRKMPSEQLFHRQRCEQGGMYPPVPLEICGCGGEETGRVSAGL